MAIQDIQLFRIKIHTKPGMWDRRKGTFDVCEKTEEDAVNSLIDYFKSISWCEIPKSAFVIDSVEVVLSVRLD